MIISNRYITPPEALWRINKFPLYKKSHIICRMDIHLPFQNKIVFKLSNAKHILSQGPKDTKLTAWFKLNQKDKNAHKYLYGEIAEHYQFNTSSRKWKKRELSSYIL